MSNPDFKAWHLLSRQLGQFKTHLLTICLLPLCWNWGSRQPGTAVSELLKVAKTADDAQKRDEAQAHVSTSTAVGVEISGRANSRWLLALPPPSLIHSSVSANTPNYAEALPLKLIRWAVPEATIGLPVWNISHIFHLLMKPLWVTTEIAEGCCPASGPTFSAGIIRQGSKWEELNLFIAENNMAWYFSFFSLDILWEISPVAWALSSCR